MVGTFVHNVCPFHVLMSHSLRAPISIVKYVKNDISFSQVPSALHVPHGDPKWQRFSSLFDFLHITFIPLRIAIWPLRISTSWTWWGRAVFAARATCTLYTTSAQFFHIAIYADMLVHPKMCLGIRSQWSGSEITITMPVRRFFLSVWIGVLAWKS